MSEIWAGFYRPRADDLADIRLARGLGVEFKHAGDAKVEHLRLHHLVYQDVARANTIGNLCIHNACHVGQIVYVRKPQGISNLDKSANS